MNVTHEQIKRGMIKALKEDAPCMFVKDAMDLLDKNVSNMPEDKQLAWSTALYIGTCYVQYNNYDKSFSLIYY